MDLGHFRVRWTEFKLIWDKSMHVMEKANVFINIRNGNFFCIVTAVLLTVRHSNIHIQELFANPILYFLCDYGTTNSLTKR